MVELAAADHTIRTALLESRYIWGDEKLFDDVQARLWTGIATAEIRAFAKQKLDERDARHARMGDSRYVVEPNVKEGKGGLRDLHALFWIGKFAYRLRSVAELVERGLFSSDELRQFERAGRFLWAVRCHLHIWPGGENGYLRLPARDCGADALRRSSAGAVERFMRPYFSAREDVGDLTGLSRASRREFARRGQRSISPLIAGGARAGWTVSRSIAAARGPGRGIIRQRPGSPPPDVRSGRSLRP